MAARDQHRTSAQAREAAASIVRRLREARHVAYFAGGCVRDELLGLEPTDYDVATDARPDAIQAMFRKTAAVGASFGVVLVKEAGGVVEVATFRSDGPYSDNRRPDRVEFADAAHDAERRDFTINALFLDPLAAEDSASIHGHVIDHVGGLADLEARVIRAVGDPERRLAEDHLRALRAVRFAARFGFAIERGTADAIREHASDLEGVSRERVGDELRRMFLAETRAEAAGLLDELSLDGVVLGVVPTAARGTALAALGPQEFLGQPVPVSFPAALAALAFDRGEAESLAQVPALIRRWRRGLCLSNEESARLRDVLEGVLEIEAGWSEAGVSSRKRRAAAAWFADALAVLQARNGKLGNLVRSDVASLAGDGIGLAPTPLIDGTDMLEAGLTPGPVFARVLSSVYDAQLEGRVSGKAEALQLAAELAGGGSV